MTGAVREAFKKSCLGGKFKEKKLPKSVSGLLVIKGIKDTLVFWVKKGGTPILLL